MKGPLTSNEILFDGITTARLYELMRKAERGCIEEDTNSFGDFLFVTLIIGGKRYQFWGAGYHHYRERYLTNKWGINFAGDAPRDYELSRLDPDWRKNVEARILDVRERLMRMEKPAAEANKCRSESAHMFDVLADLGDEDGALAMMQDLGEY